MQTRQIPRFACIAALCVMLGYSGCVLAYSVSGHARYRPLIGQTVALTRPMLLVECHSALFSSHGVATLGYAHYGLTEPDSAWGPGPIFAKLPVGHPLTIDSVHQEITGDNSVAVVYGHVVNPTSGKRASFAYTHYSQNLPWQLAASGR